jgi:WD40 repeat protein
LFGSRYCGKDENLIVSWCVDGTLCLWDSHSTGNVNAPIAVLKTDPDYPIYAVELSNDTIAVGGGTVGGFVGVPLYLYTIRKREDNATARAPNPKRSTQSVPNTDVEIVEHSTPEKKSRTEHESLSN